MKCKCPHCSGEINLSIFLNREVKTKIEVDPEELKIIASIVCENAGLTLEDFRQTKQTKDLVKARYQFMWLSFKYTDCEQKQIGRFIRPDMNHTTVIHGIRSINDSIETSTQDNLEMQYLSDKVNELLQQKMNKAC